MIKPEELMPLGDQSQSDRLEHDLHDKVDAENEPRICPFCEQPIRIKNEFYEVDGADRDYDYEAGHDPVCVNYKKQI